MIADVINIYLREHAPTVRRKDFLAYTADSILDWWGEKMLSTVRGRTCRDYVQWRCAKGVSDQTARHDLKTLRAAINYYHQEYGPLDAVPAVSLPPRAEPRSRWLSRSEAAQLLWQCRRHPLLPRFILIGLYTGTRSAAIMGLKWTTSLRSGWVDVEHGILYRRGAAERETDKRRPPCQIPPRLLAHMRRWQRRDLNRGRGSVFHGTASLKKSWSTARQRAALGKDVIPHTLRHTCVSWMLRSGHSQWDVAGFVGMSVEMIDRVYGHHSQAMPKHGRERINTGMNKRG